MPDVAGILGEAEWLTRLARSLTGSAADADDVVQDTFAAALRSPPDPDRQVRPWLRRVATNIVRMRHRERVRRDAREAVIEQIAEPTPTPEQLLERARIERTLTDLVLALEEPYRTTILLRYREGLTAEAIAQRDGVPAGTVRRRLKTAVDRLRTRLDEHETSKTWRTALAPFLAMRDRRTPWWRLVMAKTMTKTGVAVILLLLLAIGGGSLVWKARHGGARDKSATGTKSQAQPVAVMQGSAADPVVFAQAGLGRRTLAGRVTYEAKPFAGAAVRIVHALTQTPVGEAKTGEDGTFAFTGLTADAFVVTASATDKTAMPVRVDLRAPKQGPVEIALIGCSHVRGIVSDSSGGPIAHAHIARDDRGRRDARRCGGSGGVRASGVGAAHARRARELSRQGVRRRDGTRRPRADPDGGRRDAQRGRRLVRVRGPHRGRVRRGGRGDRQDGVPGACRSARAETRDGRARVDGMQPRSRRRPR